MIYHVFANRSNVGDWLSALGIQSLISPLEVRELLCDRPFVRRTLKTLSKAGPDDLVLIGGGGLFMDYFAPFWEGFREIGRRVPYCIWGVGYCDMKKQPTRAPQNLLEETVRGSRLCVVRDVLTRGHLSACDLSEPIGCPAMSVIDPPAEPGFGLLHVDAFDSIGEAVYEAMVCITEDFAHETGRPYRQVNNRIPPDSRKSLEAVVETYAASDLMVTSRLHGCIIGVAMGKKVLAVSADHKVEAFMDAAGLGDWVCDSRDIAGLPAMLRELPGQPSRAEFVQATRQANQRVAGQVKAFYAELNGGEQVT
jgi:polysaccharide pyruvyl transferase WcaK-like protein